MILSSLPVFVLIPLVELIRMQKSGHSLAPSVRRAAGGLAIAAAVYLIANPYVPINLFVNRPLLQSNFSNSMAMYEVSRLGQGFIHRPR